MAQTRFKISATEHILSGVRISLPAGQVCITGDLKLDFHHHASEILQYVTSNIAKGVEAVFDLLAANPNTGCKPANFCRPNVDSFKHLKDASYPRYQVLMENSDVFVPMSLHSQGGGKRSSTAQIVRKDDLNNHTAMRKSAPEGALTGFSFLQTLHASQRAKFKKFKNFSCVDIAAQLKPYVATL
jgi:hypothetical protein